jgi:hypothetical protein
VSYDSTIAPNPGSNEPAPCERVGGEPADGFATRTTRQAVSPRRACFADDLYELIESEGDQARAKQDKTCNGHSEEAFRSEFIPHGTPPITCPEPKRTTALLHSQRVSSRVPDFDAR